MRAQAFAAFIQHALLFGDLLERLRLAHRREHRLLGCGERFPRGASARAACATCCSSKAGGSDPSA